MLWVLKLEEVVDSVDWVEVELWELWLLLVVDRVLCVLWEDVDSVDWVLYEELVVLWELKEEVLVLVKLVVVLLVVGKL